MSPSATFFLRSSASVSFSRVTSASFWLRIFTSSAAFFSARVRFESFSCKNLLKRISDSCSSRSFFLRPSSRRRNISSLRLNSAFCASSASCTSNISLRFSSSRVAGLTCSRTSTCRILFASTLPTTADIALATRLTLALRKHSPRRAQPTRQGPGGARDPPEGAEHVRSTRLDAPREAAGGAGATLHPLQQRHTKACPRPP